MRAEAHSERIILGVDATALSFAVAQGQVALETIRAGGTGTNEDGVLALSVGRDRAVLAVADGLGGHPGGDVAARLALEALARAIAQDLAAERDLREGILDGFESANGAVLALGTGAATTLAAVEIIGRTFRPYHVGDSAILQIGGGGKIKMQTIMHSPTGYAVEAGLLSDRDARVHQDRHVVSNIVGSRGMRIDIGSVHPIAPRDTLLIASDGLFDNLSPERIAQTIRRGTLPAATRELVARCRERMAQGGKADDLTVVAWRPGQHPS
jgi:serine/threonine protein phosphatase PrpC